MKLYPSDWEPIYIETEQTERTIKDGYAQKFSLYGLTKEQFIDLAEKQGYSCLVCNTNSKTAPYRLAVDHDHTTGEIRGLLCSTCNWGIGVLGDDPDLISKAVDYLRSSRTGIFVKETYQ